MPTNMTDYLSFNRVLAIGGTRIAKEAIIAAGKFDEITGLAREAIPLSRGFALGHLGINESSSDGALAGARIMENLFSVRFSILVPFKRFAELENS